MNDILSGILPTGYDEVSDLIRIGETNFLYGGLNLVYGLDGTGKSWQTTVALEDIPDTIYLDLDGSNGKQFVKHCKKYNMHYVKQDVIEHGTAGKKLVDKVFKIIRRIIEHNRETNKEFRPVFVIDSLTSIGEGQEINNAEKIGPLLYAINNHASKLDYGLILIDHATELRDMGEVRGFKLEGNAGGKRRATVTVSRYEASNVTKPALGGVFICERARGNSSGLIKGVKHLVNKANTALAIEWVEKYRPDWLTKSISATEFANATKNPPELWVKGFRDELFDSELVGRTTYYKYKGSNNG